MTIQNEAQYEAGKQRAIAHNRRKAGRARFFLNESDAQQLSDWLTCTGEFAPKWVAKDPDDQAAMQAAIDALDTSHSNSHYDQDRDAILDACDAKIVHDPHTRGMYAGSFGDTLRDMLNAMDEWGGLTPKQAKLVRSALAKKREWVIRDAEVKAGRREADLGSEWVGEEKKRQEWTLHVSKVMAFDGQWGTTYIHLCKDAQGNVIVYKGTKRLIAGEGAEWAGKATVKKHDVRDGVKQTLITRPA